MKLYRKVIHPYKCLDDGTKARVDDYYRCKWYDEDLQNDVIREIKSKYGTPDENIVQFIRRFNLKFDARYIEVIIANNTRTTITESLEEHDYEN